MIGFNLIQCNVREYARTNEQIGLESDSDFLFDVSLFHFSPLQIYANIDELAPHFDRGYNIGCWIWEVSEIPEEWEPLFDSFNEIWTPTEFCRQAIESRTSIPVTRIPISVAPEIPPGYDRKRLGLPETGFIFLTIADFFSCAERKNPLGVLEAYRRAMSSQRSDLYLVVKINNASHRPDIMHAIREYLDQDASIIPFFDYLDRPVLNALIGSCNCLVSLHRAEGFGLPIAEAMFMGKPVIATGWSGNMDFMNERNSLPVRYQIVETSGDNLYIPYKKGSHWAEPDLNHASELMRCVATSPDLTGRIGGQAMNDIRDQLSPEAVGALMNGRLAALR
jgi:glycosyltransferase involved in cell wall biosynthesis